MFINQRKMSCLRISSIPLLIGCTALGTLSASAQTYQVEPYGTLPSGQKINQYILKNANGITVKFLNYGGIITEISTPDKQGVSKNIVLGFENLNRYVAFNEGVHFGSIIGRYANRIAKGTFAVDGKTYHLEINNPPNTLHGGSHGFDSKVWAVTPYKVKNGVGAELVYVSPDGENGFPGTLTTSVRYILDDHNALHVQYKANTDKPTIVNLTQHTYFNLAGEGSGSVENQVIQIAASHYTPVDATMIPTGQVLAVDNTVFDLRKPTAIHKYIRSPVLSEAGGYDHNFVIDRDGKNGLVFAARVEDPQTGRVLEVSTTQPGLQFYTGNGLNGQLVGSSHKAYRQTDGFALEAEHFPDSPNHPNFPSTLLLPGQNYVQETVYRFFVQ